MLSHLRDLIAHSAWADAVFLHAWAKADREDKELRERWSHSSGTQRFFLNTLRGEDDLPWPKILSGEVKPPWLDRPLPDFDELVARSRFNHAGFRELGEALTDSRLAERVTIPWFQDPPCVLTVADCALQAVMHTQHHRGQNMTRLRQIGGAPSNVDYIIWLWKGRPEPVWD